MARQPIVFVGHGSPMNAIEDNAYRREFQKLGKKLGKPKAIVAVSAHWATEGIHIRTAPTNKQINDMYGFPEELYQVRYEPAGYSALANYIRNELLPEAIEDNTWGIDHGIWSVLCNMYPDANVPVVMVSTPVDYSIEQLLAMGKRLRSLADQDVLVLASGGVVHNLGRLNWDSKEGFPWAQEFDQYIKQAIVTGNTDALLAADQHPYYHAAAPSVEHLYPVFVAAGAGLGDSVSVWNEDCIQGSLSMTSYTFTENKGGNTMSIQTALEKRRTIYHLTKELPVSQDKIVETVEKITELVPDSFNMKSSRVVVVFNEKQDELWDAVYDAFGGKVAREKIDGFKAAAGTILYFYDENVVKSLQDQFPLYAQNFPVWASQSSGMLQLSIWSALRELEVGANLQHYNPVIDSKVKAMFDVPESYVLVAQMPFGGIGSLPDAKPKEDISQRVKIVK